MSIRAGLFLFNTDPDATELAGGGEFEESMEIPEEEAAAEPNPALEARSPLAARWNRDRKGEEDEQEEGELGFRVRASGEALHEIEIRDGENTGELATATDISLASLLSNSLFFLEGKVFLGLLKPPGFGPMFLQK